MPIRVACPDCSSPVTAPDAAAGTVVRCPRCAAAMELPDAAEVARHRAAAGRRPPLQPDWEDDEDDRPRRPRRRAPAGGFPVWAAVLIGLVLVGAVGGGVYWAVRGKGGAGGGLFGGPTKYVPGESERRMKELLATKGMSELTEAEVLRAMGEPTFRGPQMSIQMNGRTVTTTTVMWQPPDGRVGSQAVFVDGRVMALNIAAP